MAAKEKGKGLFKEFKEFISKGNAMSLAIGVIIGGAFQAIVNSLVNDIIMPVVGLITGGIDFSNKFVLLGKGAYETLEEANAAINTLAQAEEAGIATLNYGNLITAIINFLIMAIVIFLIVKAINSAGNAAKSKLGKDEAEEEPAPEPRLCPYCKSEIADDATRCPHCTSALEAHDHE
ncbi:MAG: large conductance mechanosensitive channel protein MscL [Clostridia bacterium]|nr:large conductance mechanosensitive channel protein MscL [Clostridia bacterium]